MPTREQRPTSTDTARDQWWRITRNNADSATVHIFDEIGCWGLTASDFQSELADLDVSQIELRLSSPGGEVHDGFTIYETLRSHRAYVTVHIDGLAASIASVIAMAGDRRIMGRHAELMIHDAMTVCVGNAADFEKTIEDLNRESDRIARVYQDRAGGRWDTWRNRMKLESWYSAQEAVDAGLADEIAAKDNRRMSVAALYEPDGRARFRYSNRAEAPAPDLSKDEPEAEPTPAAADEPVVTTGEAEEHLQDATELEAAEPETELVEEPAEVAALSEETPAAEPQAESSASDEPAAEVLAESGDEVLDAEPEASAEPEEAAALTNTVTAPLDGSTSADDLLAAFRDTVQHLGEPVVEAPEPDLWADITAHLTDVETSQPDPWADAIAHLTAASDPDAVFASLTEALQ